MQVKGKILRSAVIAILSFLVFGCGAFLYIDQLKSTMKLDLKASLTRTANSTGKLIEEAIQDEMHTMETAASLLENEQTSDKQLLIQAMKKAYQRNTSFLRYGVADMNGDCVTTDDQKFNVQDRPYFQDASKGISSLSDTFVDVVGKHDINVFATPIYHNGKITNVLFASIETVNLAEKLLTDTYDDKGFSSVVDANGKIIIESESMNRLQSIKSLKELQFVDDFHEIDLTASPNGITKFKAPDDKLRYLAYAKLNVNDWYVLSIVPASAADARVDHLVSFASFTWLILACIFICILIYLYKSRVVNERKIDEIIFYDEVTHHYNFNRFRLKVQQQLDEHHGNEYALIELDIRDFKLFNDFYGYQAGDALLNMMMQTCEGAVDKEEACARISADRFILIFHTQDRKTIIQRMDAIVKQMQNNICQVYNVFTLHYKAGIYLIEEEDKDFSKCHDRCIYAKNQIISKEEAYYTFFSKQMFTVQLDEKIMETNMQEALEKHEFELYLQPKITLADGKVHGAEALVRWNSPAYGLLSPGKFIPLFEQNGFLEQLDMYMLAQVCQLLKTYHQATDNTLHISINISRVYIFKIGFIDRVMSIVQQYGVDPHWIELEITESVIFNRSEELVSIIRQLKEIGFHIAMDDFGSGYSSLNMLKDIPIDVMKLDQVFFHTNTLNKERSRKIIAGVLAMAKTLHIQTVAEGIEEEVDVRFLKQAGCDSIQGYYYSKPLRVQEFEVYFQKNSARES